MKYSVSVYGTVRNVAKTITKEVNSLNTILNSVFENIDYYLVESDSDDETINKLTLLSEQITNFKYVTLGKLKKTFPKRTDRIARCRNEYLNYAKSKKKMSEFSIVMDFDNINKKLNPKSLMQSIQNDHRWDVLTANQKGPYYDLFALRHKLWMPNNYLAEVDFFGSFSNNKYKTIKNVVHSKQIKIPINFGLIKVDSAFGGFAVYKKGVLEAGFYSGLTSDGEEICEHVKFCESLATKGYEIYIDSRLINANRTEHTKRFSILKNEVKIIIKNLLNIFKIQKRL